MPWNYGAGHYTGKLTELLPAYLDLDRYLVIHLHEPKILDVVLHEQLTQSKTS